MITIRGTEFDLGPIEETSQVFGQDIDLPAVFSLYDLGPVAADGRRLGFPDQIDALDRLIPDILQALIGTDQGVLQFKGPLYGDSLEEIYPHLFSGPDRICCYCPPIKQKSTTRGYMTSWISTEFRRSLLAAIPFPEIEVKVKCIVLPGNSKDVYHRFYRHDWCALPMITTILEHCLLFCRSSNDFNYLRLASRIHIEEITHRLASIPEIDASLSN